MYRQSSFRGYRSHPVYLERVNNFMAHVNHVAPNNEQRKEEELSQQFDDHDPYSSRRDQRAPPANSFNSRTASRQEPPSQQPSRSNGFAASRQQQPESRQESRKVTSSDLRQKHNKVSNQQYQGYNNPNQQTTYTNFRSQQQPSHGSFNGGRKAAANRVSLALGSGAYQADLY